MIVLHPLLRINSIVRAAARKFILPTFREGRQSYLSPPHVATMSLSSGSIESKASSARQQYIRGEVPRITVKRKIVIYVGYNGAPYHGFQRNDGVETVSDVLERALHKAGAISDGNLGFLSKISWIVSARTDKGVSAAGNAVSFKAAFPRVTAEVADHEQLSLDFSTFLNDVNAALPPEVRVFGASKTTRSFSAKDACAGRHYEYLLPLDALSPKCSLKDYADILHHFEGSHYFHNFTIGKEHKTPPPPQASRYVTGCSCDIVPVTIDSSGRQFVRIRVSGQSFMLHQIRKMVALSVMVERKMVPAESISLALNRGVLLNVAPAPAVGLFLDGVFFDAYNKRYEEALTAPIELDSFKEARESFKIEQIFPSIARQYAEEKSMEIFFQTIENHLPTFSTNLSDGVNTVLSA